VDCRYCGYKDECGIYKRLIKELNNMSERYCTNCGEELPDDWDQDMCEDCMNNLASNIFYNDDISPDSGDLF